MPEDTIKFLESEAEFVNREIEKLIPRKLDQAWCEANLGKTLYAYDIDSMNKAISEPIYNLLDRGGKRWRPALMRLCLEAVGGNPKDFLEYAIIPELIHNGSLMVDDVEDDSYLRRGKPCVHKIFGIDVAVNAGNAMYYLPTILLYRKRNLPDKKTIEIYDLISEELTRIHFGQGLDICWHKGKKDDISEKEYLQMCAFKTGTLARLAARLGVILGNGTKEQELVMGRFAETVGVAFQIRDDILSIVGEKFSLGKGSGEDIHEGKRTMMVLHALQKLPDSEKSRLVQILNSHPSDEKTIAEAISLIKKSGAIEHAKETAKKLVLSAWAESDKVLKESPAKQKLKALAGYLIERDI